MFSRPLAPKLSEALGQQVVIDSRPGAAGTIANELVAKTPPRLHAARAPGSAMAARALKVRDRAGFRAVIQISTFSCILVAHPQFLKDCA